MSDVTRLEAKVLLLEPDPQQHAALLSFCAEVGLLAVPCEPSDAPTALEAHKDLAGVLLAEDVAYAGGDGLQLALAIRSQRPELPLFLRRASARDLSAQDQTAFAHIWSPGGMASLRDAVESAIFSLLYPVALVQGVMDLSLTSLRAMFPNAQVDADAPYVVHDRIIHGEVSTLIALESTWCRGYMMLQTQEDALRQGLIQGLSYEGVGGDFNFREINNMLGEITNLIWGAFKNRYIPPHAFANQQTQVPIVINHAHKYISFGSPDPQLCVRYHLRDSSRSHAQALTIVQRFIFNLHWSPEQFAEFSAQAAAPGDTGELDLF